ncbi:MAG: DUF1566 domain-containing protein [Acidobacteriota bacterium]
MGRSSYVAMLCAAWLAVTSLQAMAGCNPKKPAPPVTDRFVIQGETVKDKLTGLTWKRCSVGQKWKEKIGCVGLVGQVNFGAAQDEEGDGWRLPRPAELRSLFLGRCRNPSINEEAFPDMDPDFQWYWAYDGKMDQVVNFGEGNPPFCNGPKCKGNAVRLVRRDVDVAAATPAP